MSNTTSTTPTNVTLAFTLTGSIFILALSLSTYNTTIALKFLIRGIRTKKRRNVFNAWMVVLAVLMLGAVGVWCSAYYVAWSGGEWVTWKYPLNFPGGVVEAVEAAERAVERAVRRAAAAAASGNGTATGAGAFTNETGQEVIRQVKQAVSGSALCMELELMGLLMVYTALFLNLVLFILRFRLLRIFINYHRILEVLLIIVTVLVWGCFGVGAVLVQFLSIINDPRPIFGAL
ncbi:hypothetical protein HK102_007515, partial [Quaeritorhiza haematococci]